MLDHAGSWAKSKKDGHGKYYYLNGDTYEGEWRKNKKEGSGAYTFAATGAVYIGTWRNGKRHGFGELSQGPACKYRGRFKKDKVCRGFWFSAVYPPSPSPSSWIATIILN